MDGYFNEKLAEKVKAGEMTIESALMKAYANGYVNGVRELENACTDKSRKMCTASSNHVYYRAVGTRVIKECADEIIINKW